MPECVRIAHEHTVEIAMVKSTSYFLKSCRKTNWCCGHHLLEEEASRRNETLGFVLSAQDLEGLQWPSQCVEDALMKFHTTFLPELSEGPLMADGHHVLEEVASRRHEILDSVLSVWTHSGRYGQHNAHVFLCRREKGHDFQGIPERKLR